MTFLTYFFLDIFVFIFITSCFVLKTCYIKTLIQNREEEKLYKLLFAKVFCKSLHKSTTNEIKLIKHTSQLIEFIFFFLVPKIKQLQDEVDDVKTKDLKPFELPKELENQNFVLQAFDGFLLVLSADGDITYVSENICDLLGLAQVIFFMICSIYSNLLH